MRKRNHDYRRCYVCLKSPYKNRGVSLHRFPSSAKQRFVWLKACQMTEGDYFVSRKICSSHFDQNCFKPKNVKNRLKYGSVPTIFTQKDLDRLKFKREWMYEGGRIIPIQRSRLTNEAEDKSKKSVKILKVSSNEKDGISERGSSDGEKILFCPFTMVRYDIPNHTYKTVWVCRNCLSLMLSEDAVHKHLNILCEHRYNMPDFENIKKYDDDDDDDDDDDIENNGDDGGYKVDDDNNNKEDDDKDNNEDCEEGNKKNYDSCTDNEEDDDDDDDVEDDSDDDYHVDDEDEEDDNDDEDEDDEIKGPYELKDLLNSI